MTCLRGAASAAGAELLRADPLVDEPVVEDEAEVDAVVAEDVVAEGFTDFEGGEADAAGLPLSPGS